MTNNPAAITNIEGTAMPLQGNDVDTDRIIPARFLRCVTFDGLGEQVFRDERFDPDGNPQPHSFNDATYSDAAILFVNRNFGCGSSREHAPQAIMRFGIKAIVGESFAEIFAGNCTSLGIPVLSADEAVMQRLQAQAQDHPATRFSLDIEEQSISFGDQKVALQMNPAAQSALLGGTWNTLDELMQNVGQIEQVSERLPYINGF